MEDVIKDNLIKSGLGIEDYNEALNQNKVELPLSYRKPNPLIKLYIALGIFITFGFIVFIIKFSLSNSGNTFLENSQWNDAVNIFLMVWGIVFAYILPLGLVNFGLWSILYKESGIENPATTFTGIHSNPVDLVRGTNTYSPVVKVQGKRAVVAGIFYLILGLVIAWGVTGVLLGLVCKLPVCISLPKFIKFF